MLSWLFWLAMFWLPLVALLIWLSYSSIHLLGAYVLLHNGGLSVPQETFDQWRGVAAWVVLAALLRQLLRYPSSGSSEERQRVIGPGGRVLRVFFAPNQRAAGVRLRIARWLPAPWLLLCAGAVVGFLGWDVHSLTVPSVFLTLTNLLFFLACIEIFLLRTAYRLARGIYRFSRGSEYRAGAVTVLLFLLGLPGAVGLVALDPSERHKIAAAPEEAWAVEAPAFERSAYYDTAVRRWPMEALREDLRRYAAPLLARGHGSAANSVSVAPWHGRTLLAGEGTDEDIGTADDCLRKLRANNVPTLVGRLKRDYHQLTRDDVYDVTIEAMLTVCSKYVPSGYQRISYLLVITAQGDALDLLRKEANRRRILKERYLPEQPASCPVPWDDESVILQKQIAIAADAFQSLSDEQKIVVYEHAILEEDYDTIARENKWMQRARLRDDYNNALKKMVSAAERCRTQPAREVPEPEVPAVRRRPRVGLMHQEGLSPDAANLEEERPPDQIDQTEGAEGD